MDWRRAPATFAIGAATALIGLVLLAFGLVDTTALTAGFIPLRWSEAVDVEGGLWLLPAWATPFSAALIHASGFHLFFNVAIFVIAGTFAERALGARGIVALWVAGAIAGAIGEWLVDPFGMAPRIGASAAAAAVLGAHALLMPQKRARAIGPLPAGLVQALWLFAAWTAINLLLALTGMPIAIAGHIAGFAIGLVLARPLLAWQWRGA